MNPIKRTPKDHEQLAPSPTSLTPTDEKTNTVSISQIQSFEPAAPSPLSCRRLGTLSSEERQAIDFFKEFAKRDGKKVSQEIINSHITDEPSLIEIAKIAAAQNGRWTSKHIRNYEIQESTALIEIAEIAVRQSGRGVCEYLDNYNITDPERIINILQIAALHFGLDAIHNAYQHAKKSLSRIDPNEFNKILLSALAFSLFENKKDEIKKFYNMLVDCLNPSFDVIKALEHSSVELFRSLLIEQRDNLNLPEFFYSISDKILKYRGKKIAEFLLGTLMQNAEKKDYIKSYLNLTTEKGALVIPRLLPSIVLAKWLSGLESEKLKNFLSKHTRVLKDQTAPLLPALLNAQRDLDLLEGVYPMRKIDLLGMLCLQELEDIVKSLKLVSYFAIRKEVDLLNKIEPNINNLHKAYKNILLSYLSTFPCLPPNPIERYEETFGQTIRPYALEIYQTTLFHEEPIVQDTLIRFIQSVLLDNFLEERHRTDINPHLKKIEESNSGLLDAWKNFSFSLRISDTESVFFTQAWKDLFLAGEVKGSCQRVDASSSDSKCLLAYCLDGKIAMLAIKNIEEKILARSILKLLIDKDSNIPVLFLEALYPYPSTPEREFAILSAAHTCAEQLGCPLLQQAEGVSGKWVVSLGSSCPYEYADAAGGVQKNGIYEIQSQPVTSHCPTPPNYHF